MKVKTLLAAFAVATAGVGALALVATRPEAKTMNTYATDPCAKIKFGMKDDNTGGVEETGFGTGSMNTNASGVSAGTYSYADKTYDSKVGIASGVTIKSVTVTDYVYYAANYALKFGKSKTKSGAVSYTFDENVVSIDVYALGWSGDTVTITINDDDDLSASVTASASGTGIVDNIVYEKKHFEFSATKTIKIAFDGRGIVGHIAIRKA